MHDDETIVIETDVAQVRIVTVRMSAADHVRLINEAHDARVSLNTLALQKLGCEQPWPTRVARTKRGPT